MKIFDRIKSYFYDDEEVEGEKEHKNHKKEEKSKPVKKEEIKEEKPPVAVKTEDVIGERELFKSDPTFKFPVIFDEEDFVEEKPKSKRINVLENEHHSIVNEPIVKKPFKPSLVISPIYGVMDPNKNDGDKSQYDSLLDLYDENKKVDIDVVLNKVYSKSSTNEVELKYDDTKERVTLRTGEEVSIDLFDDVETPQKEEVTLYDTHVTIKEEKISDVDHKLKTIDELLEETSDEDFYSLVDSMYKDVEEEGENK